MKYNTEDRVFIQGQEANELFFLHPVKIIC